ncbi:MAG TPA: hypothetical protein VGM68_07025 [Rhizomicrobium sp.]
MKATLAALAAMLFVGTAVPAFAAWDEVGRVDIGFRGDRETRDVRFGGAVEGLQLRAEGNDINCRSVRARFGNGSDREIFRGRLRQGDATNIDLPGDRRSLRSLSFQCTADSPRRASIRVVADVGRYRDEWRRNPDFDRMWSRTFNWGSDLVNDWQYLGAEDFRGRGDRETSFAGWRGRNIDALALKPVGADARCSRVVAMFRGGRPMPLDVNRGDFLREGQYYKLDIPGDRRNLEAISLACRPMNGRQVSVQIFTSK